MNSEQMETILAVVFGVIAAPVVWFVLCVLTQLDKFFK
nr:MAG TPA: aerobic respiration control sensor protein [Caudoviricetes sp.]